MKCRHCDSELSIPFLDLGSAPPSNAYLSESGLIAPEVCFPLRVLVCESCWLVQTEDHAGREALFTDDYAYFSSFSRSWLEHAQHYAMEIVKRFSLGAEHRVVEVAANDGYLLQYIQEKGIPCYGIEPTKSTAKAARDKGIDIVEQFFGRDTARNLVSQKKSADLMIANNVLAHVPDINDFVSGFSILLKPEGVATFEFPHLLQLVEKNQFDTVYHEHYSYLSLSAVNAVFEHNGLTIFDVEQLSTHGGSLRVFAQLSDSGVQPVQKSVLGLLSSELEAGICSASFYKGFQHKAQQVKDNLLFFLLDAKRKGLRVAAYGAAAKGNTLLNFAGVRPDLLEYVIDKNPSKLGKYMPGSRIPIVDESRLKEDKPDYILILPWNLKSEIAHQLHYIKSWGGQLVVAVPRLEDVRL